MNEKLEALKNWLSEHGYDYVENYKSEKLDVVMDLRVINPRIAVKVAEKDDDFYKKVKRVYSPFFVRETESLAFTLEKIANCIEDAKLRERIAGRFTQKQKAVEKKKRKRIVRAEKIIPRGC